MLAITRTKFPNGHFSLRQLETYLSCPYQYYLTYVRKMKWPKVPSGAAFGSAMHRAIELTNKMLFNGGINGEGAASIFASEWELENKYGPVEFKESEDPDELLEKGRTLIKMYCNQFGHLQPQAVEQEFELPIPGRRFFKPKTVKGRLDLVADNELIEFKTGARSKTNKEVDASLQLTMYSWAYRKLYGREENTLKIVVLIKTKKPKVQVIETQRTERDHVELMETADQVIRAIKHKVFHKNPCTRFGCGYCVYQDVCKGGARNEYNRTTSKSQ